MIFIKNKDSRRLIVSIAIGEVFLGEWNQYIRETWQSYALKQHCDIIIFTEPLDKSKRAAERSVSWQKCLVLNPPECRKYERILWLDSDILINPEAPCVFSQVPSEKIGATNAYSFISEEMHDYLYGCYIDYCKKRNKKLVINPTPASYYQNFGIHTELNEVLQAGVLVLNPEKHKDILNKVYNKYEEKYDEETGYAYNYEMRPLSYEIIKAELHHFIDYRFNFILSNYLYYAYPYLCHSEDFTEARAAVPKDSKIIRLALTSAYCHSWFLHFAGGEYWKIMLKFVDLSINKPSDFDNYEEI